MSTTYPTGQRTGKPTIGEALGPLLRESGLVSETNDELTGDPRMLTTALSMGLRQLGSSDPWSEPTALTIRADWCSIDGSEPGDLQVRVTPNGVQLRERTPATMACLDENHFVQTCTHCWSVRALNPTSQWYPASERVQVRINPTDNSTACRVEVRRRIYPNAPQPEIIWSEPWQVPEAYTTEFNKKHQDDRSIDTTWVDVAPDVQVSRGHTFPRGILVRQATGREDKPWTTPRFLPETHWRWVDLIPDDSMQFRCWRAREEEGNFGGYRMEVRQRVGRKPVLVAEPTWGESKSGSFVGRTEYSNGYALTLFLQRNHRGYGYRGVEGLRVVTPQGETIEILDYDRDIQATPDLLVHPSYQGYFSWRHAVSDPEAARTLWTMPEERLLRHLEWTHLSDTVRAKMARRGRGVRVEVLVGVSVRRHWWSRPSLWVPYGTKSFGTTHHLGDTVRATFRPDQVAEIQYVVPTELEQ